MGVGPEELLHGEAYGRGQLNHHELSAGAQHAAHFAQSLVEILKVAYAVGHCDRIEAVGREREVQAVFALETDDVAEPGFLYLAAAHLHHPLRQVDAQQLIGMQLPGSQQGKVARAGGHVEYVLGGVGTQGIDGRLAPMLVDAQ